MKIGQVVETKDAVKSIVRPDIIIVPAGSIGKVVWFEPSNEQCLVEFPDSLDFIGFGGERNKEWFSKYALTRKN